MLSVEGLVDLPHMPGSTDCYGMVRGIYALNFGIELTDFARPSNWDSDDLDLIGDYYERDGFEKISTWKLADLRPGDVMALAVSSSTPNHLGVYLGDNKFAHHPYGHLSRVSPMAGSWIHATCYVLRHPDVPDLRPALKSVTLPELLRARYQK